MAIRRNSSGLYIAYFRLNGKMTSRSLMTHDSAEAQKRHKLLMQTISFERFCIRNGFKELSRPVSNRVKLENVLKIAKKKRNFSKDTITIWQHFVRDIGATYADEVTPEIALNYLETHFSSGNGKRYNNIKSALNTVYRNVLVECRMSASPFANIVNRKVDDVDHRRNLTDEELSTVLPMLPTAMQCAAMLSRWTTQRLETVCRMTPEMFDWEKGAFIIMPSKTARFDEFVVCPILPKLRKYLLPKITGMKTDQPIVAQLSDGRKYTPGYISDRFCEALTAAGIVSGPSGKVGFHSIRGTAITWYKEHGFNSDVLRRITGHTTTAMEDTYARDVKPVLDCAKKITAED